MNNIIYLKKVNSYDEVLKKKYNKIPLLFKKIIFLYKNIFNIITKKKIDADEVWILPVQEKCSANKMKSLIKQMALNKENVYILSNGLNNVEIHNLMDFYGANYFKEQNIKKILVIKILEFISSIQKSELKDIEITLLVNDASDINIYLIEKLSKLVKSIKIVSLNIYKFKKIEEKLYNDYGIAIQFSNSYKKSMSKSQIIINIDFNLVDINEYNICNNAIIINCMNESLKIKSKLFNGIIINSCNISFSKEIKKYFKRLNIYHKFNKLALYQGIISKEKKIESIFENIDENKVNIIDLIGNNGIINKNEIKNIHKTLDKK